MTDRTRSELSKEVIADKGSFVWSKIKTDFHNSKVSYIDRDDIKFVMGRNRETKTVLPNFKAKVLKELDSVVADVGGGRLAIVKK